MRTSVFLACSQLVLRCAKSFNSGNYMCLFGINTSICEQFHAYISRFRAAATGMKLANFVRCLRMWVDLWNAEKVAKMKKT